MSRSAMDYMLRKTIWQRKHSSYTGEVPCQKVAASGLGDKPVHCADSYTSETREVLSRSRGCAELSPKSFS